MPGPVPSMGVPALGVEVMHLACAPAIVRLSTVMASVSFEPASCSVNDVSASSVKVPAASSAPAARRQVRAPGFASVPVSASQR